MTIQMSSKHRMYLRSDRLIRPDTLPSLDWDWEDRTVQRASRRLSVFHAPTLVSSVLRFFLRRKVGGGACGLVYATGTHDTNGGAVVLPDVWVA